MVKMRDTPYMNYLFLYVFCFQIIFTNSRSSTVWKLVPEEGIIVDASDDEKLNLEDDPIFKIVTSTVYHGNMWIKTGNYNVYESDCQNNDQYRESSDDTATLETNGDNIDDEYLDCGKAVNYTYYDNLVGVARRHRHPNVPEPQVALIFTKKKTYKNGGVVSEFDIKALEKRLKKAKREKPKSVQLYNQIGNYWRIKGDTRLSIECFRRALAVSPYNAEVLLNLARVLFTLQYLDDAIYLTRRSLEVQPPDRSAWQQYFTLGEIFKAYGHYQEAAVHLKHSLDLRPDFEPAATALKDIASIPEASLHVYTLLIIICLVLGVLLVIMSSVDNGGETEEHKTQRHFNRAMAMRSLRGVTFSAHGSRSSRRKGGS